jgi:hypothetical protein
MKVGPEPTTLMSPTDVMAAPDGPAEVLCISGLCISGFETDIAGLSTGDWSFAEAFCCGTCSLLSGGVCGKGLRGGVDVEGIFAARNRREGPESESGSSE